MGEGNGNPLQCSCLENPRDGGAWWAAVYGVAQSRTRLKRLSSSSSMPFSFLKLFLSLLQYYAHFTAPSPHILGRRASSLSLPHLFCTHTCIQASHRSYSLYINGVWISISRPRLHPEFQTLISNCLLKDSHKCHILLVAKLNSSSSPQYQWVKYHPPSRSKSENLEAS